MKLQDEIVLANLSFITYKQLAKTDYDLYLTPSEKKALAYKPDKKRHLSIMGRVAVKDAIKKHMGAHTTYQEIEIFNTPTGVPRYKINGQEQRIPISISHSKNLAIGGLLKNATGFGLDIEKIRDFNENTIRSFTTDLEWKQYNELTGERKRIFPTLIWSIKEATLKALGEGLRLHPKNIAVTLTDQLQIVSVLIIDNNLEVKATWTLFGYSYIIVSIQLYEKSRNSCS